MKETDKYITESDIKLVEPDLKATFDVLNNDFGRARTTRNWLIFIVIFNFAILIATLVSMVNR